MSAMAFKTEAALCAAFIAWATPQGVTCYAEWLGWDILVVYPDGAQLGIQAKLRLNAEVRWDDAHWTDWNPPRRHDLPPTATDAIAGSPCPVTLTPWKLAALDVLAELELRGTITTKRMKELHVDPRRWLAWSWLLPAPTKGEWIRGARCPKFDGQHPTAFALAVEKARSAAAEATA